MTTPPHIFDARLWRNRAKRFRPQFQRSDFVLRRVLEDMADSLGAINRNFQSGLELNALPLRLTEFVPEGKITHLNEEVRDIDLDATPLPYASDSLDLIVSALGLHRINDVPGALVQIRRALKPDGFFIAAMMGGETLTELRQCLIEAELEVRGGYGPRIFPFAESHDVIELMKRIGFAMPVVDSDRLKVSYEHPLALMHDLRSMGESNILLERPKTGLNKAILERLCALYFEKFSNDEGRIIASFEIIHLSGWKPHESQQKPLKPGTAKMRLSDALGVKEIKL